MPGPATATAQEYNELEATLLNTTGDVPLAKRFRALFTLRGLKSHRAIDIIGQGFKDSSALLGHELAYVLGQINDPYALPVLESVLRDEDQHPMVRHEAAEAMGAISQLSSLPVLEEFLHKPNEDISVVETCEIAIAKIQFDHANAAAGTSRSLYDSIDPAPPTSMHDTDAATHQSVDVTISELRTKLLDTQKSLFERYRAMFALRNLGENKEAVLALADGFGDKSALFRHEIAYIFGQLSSPHSVPSLLKVLANDAESEMVRHEAAEALGSIATDEVLPALEAYRTQGPRVVRESCEVALDMYEYENSGELHYAPTVKNVESAPVVAASA